MIETVLLCIYAAASIALAIWVRRAIKMRLDWWNPAMRRPMVEASVRTVGGVGAQGAADAVSTAVLTSASPAAGLIFLICVGGLFGSFVGAGVLPALAGGVVQPGWLGVMALVVAAVAWAWIGGCLTMPVLRLAFGWAPALIGLFLIAFAGLAYWQTMGYGRYGPIETDGRWLRGFNMRADRNLCVAGVGLISLGNALDISRKCRVRALGPHPAEGRFAGVYSCQPGQRIGVIVDVRSAGNYRDEMKNLEFSFSDRPEAEFPQGRIIGSLLPNSNATEFRSDGLQWGTQPAGSKWGIPQQIVVTARADGGINVGLTNTSCSTVQAARCVAEAPGRSADCKRELATAGVQIR